MLCIKISVAIYYIIVVAILLFVTCASCLSSGRQEN